ncbi:hypothetical protein KSP39_PZI017466 [Platanthera zijinensis]|uniref:Uncharacterized protein n=1 Tax=Platanthera zijinensis TaxID=2320716 RepID=A0AAP0G0J3_9ASPA
MVIRSVCRFVQTGSGIFYVSSRFLLLGLGLSNNFLEAGSERLAKSGAIGDRLKETQVQGILNLIGLAGSERLAKSGATGDRLKETQMILIKLDDSRSSRGSCHDDMNVVNAGFPEIMGGNCY